jgi:hypothetical protein
MYDVSIYLCMYVYINNIHIHMTIKYVYTLHTYIHDQVHSIGDKFSVENNHKDCKVLEETTSDLYKAKSDRDMATDSIFRQNIDDFRLNKHKDCKVLEETAVDEGNIPLITLS